MAFAGRVKYPNWTSRIEIHFKLVSCVCIEDGPELAEDFDVRESVLRQCPALFFNGPRVRCLELFFWWGRFI